MDPVPRALLSAIIKIIIWLIPVFLLVIMVEQRNPFSYLGLRHNLGKGLKWAGWTSLAFLLYFVILNLVVLKKEIDFNIGFNEWLNTILLVGIIEEIVFRGFLLRKFIEYFNFWKANIIVSLLFVSIHFPIWFYKGLFEYPYILNSIITAFVLSVIFGFVYKKTNSLWSVIIIHSLYNLLVSIFY
ncbi:membrane protease YdiL (CAAX protease family) [Virgibacillus natechei]|uniref:Membrane protease YdiL (CAAX protease family) n=1 Tax=Virgibacillus natechei TaxID=1216297 RepID=A0ABS4IHT4_9BACI|nr:CPBP family intramembrane glutamic endopeptidase [Virgibacillus natechei]MBP1970512.1 membrane protease YdiL (CAAX protease family) [Virgibacillus natechei]UZD14864.1 CPBP family intramembrane metalloprotease [Virgibacillus natechei]